MRHSPPPRSPSPPAKRPRSDPAPQCSSQAWTRIPVRYGQGLHLAPMVRSGSLPTRLLALDAGVELVWGPETVDRAIIGCTRVTNDSTGVISYMKGDRTIFTLHPVERPRLIFQIGSSNPELAAQAAATVCNDVAGIDLNCGCPKPFSTHAGMGAGLLHNPANLCAILHAIRAAIPLEIPVSCKIRLLPSQEDTLALVKQIVDTGAIKCLTVHCRTPPMRDREAALIHRLRELVDAVDGRVEVVENGDCLGLEDAERIRSATGVRAVMIARAAETNPYCFSNEGLLDAETVLIPRYLKLAKSLGNAWPNSKFCVIQFTSPRPLSGKEGRRKWKAAIASAKSYDDIARSWKEDATFLEGGDDILQEITRNLATREGLSVRPWCSEPPDRAAESLPWLLPLEEAFVTT